MRFITLLVAAVSVVLAVAAPSPVQHAQQIEERDQHWGGQQSYWQEQHGQHSARPTFVMPYATQSASNSRPTNGRGGRGANFGGRGGNQFGRNFA